LVILQCNHRIGTTVDNFFFQLDILITSDEICLSYFYHETIISTKIQFVKCPNEKSRAFIYIHIRTYNTYTYVQYIFALLAHWLDVFATQAFFKCKNCRKKLDLRWRLPWAKTFLFDALHTHIHATHSSFFSIEKNRPPFYIDICMYMYQGPMLWSQFSAIFDNFRRKNWCFSQKPMLWSKFCII
jgi:hypothetical protein